MQLKKMKETKTMNKKELVEELNRSLNDAWEDLEHSSDHQEEFYACGWIDCINNILKFIGEPTPTDVEAIMQEMKNTNPRTAI